MPRLSSITITGNEAINIGDCLDSLAFCDERVVVDGGSKDDTVEIAGRHGGTVHHHPWTDHGTQKGIALSHATGDWVLLLDADERVTPALAAEIKAAIENPTADGYEMPRLSSFCGREMWHSGWYPDYVLRLFRRERGRFSPDPVHTRVICDGKIARLSEPLVHFAIRHIDDSVSKMNAYSTAGAKQLVDEGRKIRFGTGIAHGMWAFFRGYVLRLGFLDGREGFMLAVANAEGTYYKYLKAWLMGQRRD